MTNAQLPLHLSNVSVFCVRPPKRRLNHHPYVVWMAVLRPGDGRVLNCHLAPQLQRNDAGVQSCFGPSAPIGFSKFSCLKYLEPLVFPSVKSSKAPQKVFQKRGHQSHSQYLTINPQSTENTIFPKPLLKLPRHPKAFLSCGFPHVAQLTLPWAWIIGPDIGAQTPHATQLLRDFLAQEPEGAEGTPRHPVDKSEEIWKLNLLHLTSRSFLLEKTNKKCWDLCSQLLFQLQKLVVFFFLDLCFAQRLLHRLIQRAIASGQDHHISLHLSAIGQDGTIGTKALECGWRKGCYQGICLSNWITFKTLIGWWLHRDFVTFLNLACEIERCSPENSLRTLKS